VCILNQETAKNFLHSSDATQKYKLFERATQMDVMSYEFSVANEELNRSKSCIKEKIQVYSISFQHNRRISYWKRRKFSEFGITKKWCKSMACKEEMVRLDKRNPWKKGPTGKYDLLGTSGRLWKESRSCKKFWRKSSYWN